MLAFLMLFSAQAETVAQVVAVDGQVYIDQGGEQIAATQALDIDRSATLITTEESQLYLLLHNNRVVAFSDELELPVSKIAALGDARVDTPVQEQLKALMDSSDQARMGSMIAETEKIGGWEARLTSARTYLRGNSAPGGGAGDGVMAEDEEDTRKLSKSRAAPAASLESTVAGLTADAAGQKCVKKWAKKAKLAGDSVEIMVKLVDGRITHAFTADGEGLAKCMEEQLIGKELDASSLVDAQNGTAELELP